MSRTRTLLIAATTLIFASVTLGQTGGQLAARPDRGPTPGGAYSVSDFDSVSLTGGALGLSIPLASLPPIAGGKLGVTITARYNSKVWNVWRRERQAPGLGFRTYVVDEPQPADEGGWTVAGPRYDVRFREASEDFTYLTPQQDQTTLDDWRQLQYTWWRAYLLTPDGAEHELTPSEPARTYSGLTRTYLFGSFRDTPLTRNAPMRYHTTDGTYLSVIYHPDGTWAVTSPGGTRAVKSSDGSQRITDVNGNSVLIYTDPGWTTHFVDEQTGRELRDEQTAAGRRVWYQTVGGAWRHVDVTFGSTRVRGKVYRVNDWNSAAQTETGQEGAPCVRHETLDKTLAVVR